MDSLICPILSEYEYIKREVLEGFRITELPLILTGDFNIDLHMPEEFDPFIEHLGVDYPIISGDIQFTVDSKINNLVEASKERPVIKEVLDYIFLLPGEANEQLSETYILNPKAEYTYQRSLITAGSLSDHLPVISIINL